MCNHEKISLNLTFQRGNLREAKQVVYFYCFYLVPGVCCWELSGVDTWHRARIVACLLMNKIPPSYCSSLQAFMTLNFGLCNFLVERWYRSRDGTRRL